MDEHIDHLNQQIHTLEAELLAHHKASRLRASMPGAGPAIEAYRPESTRTNPFAYPLFS